MTPPTGGPEPLPVLLDLYCGGGGAGAGYDQAGFEVIGVDSAPMPRYPFAFILGDALAVLDLLIRDGSLAHPLTPGRRVTPDAVHASPPCQAFSIATVALRNAGAEYPDLVQATRERLERLGVPWVIENVPGAPVRPDFKLCGCMFALPLLERERWFETSWHGFAMRSPCYHSEPALSVTGHGVGGGNGQLERVRAFLGRNPGIADARAAMGIDWVSRGELSQAIPPAFTEYMGAQLREQLAAAAATKGEPHGD